MTSLHGQVRLPDMEVASSDSLQKNKIHYYSPSSGGKHQLWMSIFLGFMSILSIPTSAQINADIIRPSVNADQFGLALKAESALSKGQLSLSIPLMELKGKGYDLPISLTFYNGDVTSCTEASPIGLGWALMAGGVVTTTIRGADDLETYTGGWLTEHHRDSNYISNEYRKDQTNNFDFIYEMQHDPMPDEYTYSLPGHSGTIDVSFEGNTINRTLFPDESYKIAPTRKGYCITADDGTKFYFENIETRVSCTRQGPPTSVSWFLTRIETAKGGIFTFNYADEEYVDLSSIRDYNSDYDIYHTQRISSICSEFGSVTFYTGSRSDRGDVGNRHDITTGLESKRINRIVLKDENGNFVKGYELDNSGTFKLHELKTESPDDSWYNRRLMLSSITQYDAAGNRLPPYRFTYDYKFSKSRFAYSLLDTDSHGNYIPYESWTSQVGTQVYVDINECDKPLCYIGNQSNGVPSGLTESSDNYDASTTEDYFCLNSICYPTGAIDDFFYDSHNYNKVNWASASYLSVKKTQGKRLAGKMRHGLEVSQLTEYKYELHDANYNRTGVSSGVMTNPSIHNATYYTPEWNYGWIFHASRITSDKPFNSFMGPPVCYTEVEEVEHDAYGDTLRTIHYFEPQIVTPPVNYVLVKSPANLVKIENRIYGTKTGYSNGMASYNNKNCIYMAYPVGDFCNIASVVDKPLKEVFIGRDGNVKSIKDYYYYAGSQFSNKKYGYKIVTPKNSDYTLISRSEYITRRTRLYGTNTTCYYYNGNKCDSICEEYLVGYNKGRTNYTCYSRGYGDNKEKKISQYYFPDGIPNIMESNASPEIAAIKGLIGKNMVADPIKAVIKRNDEIISGECRDYQMLSDKPLLKSLYKLKTPTNKYSDTPTISGDKIDYHAELYTEGEIKTYDNYDNPEYVRLNDTQDRIYVWGYDGRYPIAVIDNMTDAAFRSLANLKTKILELASFKKIGNQADCTKLRNLNAAIRSMLPDSAHITTYTYDPYFGMTSETDDSNLGRIYAYDTFGRLFATYDVNYKKTEEYDYHYKLQ